MRTPHVQAVHHLPLLPGTNVAVLTALAHVIVTEGLVNETFVRELYARKNVLVLPGSYMARETGGTNPGRGRVRVSLVASVSDCVAAAH